jgi:hypothetical protein
MRTKPLATLPLEHEELASDTLEDIAWPEFRHALQQLSHASCCSAGSAGAMAVNLRAAPPVCQTWLFGLAANDQILSPSFAGSI